MEGFDCYTQFTIDVYGCDSADLDQDTKEVGSDVFVLSRISDE